MDDIDRDILTLLHKNGRSTAAQAAREVCLSASATAARIRALEAAGVIRGYHADVTPEALGYGVEAFVLVCLDGARQVEPFRQAAVSHGMVAECHHLAGEYDYLLRVFAGTTGELEEFLSCGLRRMPGVSRILPIISISRLK
ncbi:MAG TPA: Lrp/AsnC family transcriptional regulator [Terriglobales bacterium]|nr:Lrp/AsnC family transcriptional regulator [Terriglobales bacterium]